MTIITDELRRLFDYHERENLTSTDVEREVVDTVVRYYMPHANIGFVLYSRLSEDDDLNAVIQAQIDYYQERGAHSFEWKYYDYDKPDALPIDLAANGLQPEDKEAVMVLSHDSAPDILRTQPTHDIRKVIDTAMLDDADRVHATVWKNKSAVSERVLPMWEADPESVSVYIAYVDDTPVSYGRVEFAAGNQVFASIWGGATLPDYRRRGIYTQLVAARMQEAVERGYRYLTVDANTRTSMPILEKLGFERLTHATAFVWHALD